MKPSVGRIVHYQSQGSAGGEYASECQAAIITEVNGIFDEDDEDRLVGWDVGLAVLNPQGMFFKRFVDQDESSPPRQGGTWHWPERVE